MTRPQIPAEQAPRRTGARPVAALKQGRADWYRIDNMGGSATLHVYDEIGYYGVTAADLVADLSALDVTDLTVHINSPGGDVFDGITIYNALVSHQAQVTTVVDGLAASIASVIAMAGDQVVMSPHSQMMIHDAMGMCVGNAADMAQMIDVLNRCSDSIAAVYAAKAGGDVAQWRGAMRAETWYTAEEAVAAGLADSIAKRKQAQPDEDAPGMDVAAAWDLSLFAHAGREHAPAPQSSRPVARQEPRADPVPAGTPQPPSNQVDAEQIRAVMRGAFG